VDFKVCPRDAIPLEDVAGEDEDRLLGALVGDAFRIERLVGEGGMARVYEARHLRLPSKRFAIKVLSAAYSHQPDVVARFQREAEAASGINHPNVVDVYDVNRTSDGTPYLVTEFLRGTDFATLLQERGQLEVGLTIHIVRQVVRALGAAHARGIVHRDVKPENVFLVGDGRSPLVKVLDFGISKVEGPEGGGSTLTRTGMIMGTPGYMPPEQARGSRVDHRADIYGVGAMLYRALTGQLPFDSEDPAETLGAVLTQEPPRPRSLEPSIPEPLELVIERAMAKDPEERYPSMAELDADLEAFSPEDRSVSILPPPGVASMSGGGTLGGSTTTSPTLVTGRRPAPTALQRVAKEVKWSRPSLVLFTVSAYVWAGACLADALASMLVLTRGGETKASSTEAVLIAGVVVALSLTPTIFWLRHLSRSVWRNSSRALEAAALLRRVTLAGVVFYAAAALALRLVGELSPWTLPASQYFGILLSTGSLTAGFATFLTRR
jgi:serine/threonine-protein kinase